MFGPMSEGTLQLVIGIASILAIVTPLVLFGSLVAKSLRAGAFELVDRNGDIITKISADTLKSIEPSEIARLRERIRQKHDVSIRADTSHNAAA
jgi:hypothetical protein